MVPIGDAPSSPVATRVSGTTAHVDDQRARRLGAAAGAAARATASRPSGESRRAARTASTNGRVEQLVQRAARRPSLRASRRTSVSSAVFHRTMRSSRSTTSRPSSSDSRMFSLNARSRSSSTRLDVELPVEPRVLERGGDLAGHRAPAAPCLRCSAARSQCLQAEREHGGRPRLRDARHEVEEAGVAPELDVFRRVASRRRSDRRASRRARRRAAGRCPTASAAPAARVPKPWRASTRTPRRSRSSTISAIRSTTSVSTTRDTSRCARLAGSRSLFRSRAKPTSARR